MEARKEQNGCACTNEEKYGEIIADEITEQLSQVMQAKATEVIHREQWMSEESYFL